MHIHINVITKLMLYKNILPQKNINRKCMYKCVKILKLKMKFSHGNIIASHNIIPYNSF